MPPWLQNIHPGAIIGLLFLLAPAVGRILKALAEQKKKRDEQIARERAEIERMRLGQPAQAPSAMTRLEQAAARRPARPFPPPAARPRTPGAARVRQLPRPGAAAPGPDARATTTLRLPGGIVLKIPTDAAPKGEPSGEPARPRPAPRQEPAPAPGARPEPAAAPGDPGESAAQRLVSEQIAATARPPQRRRPKLYGEHFGPGDWKRAIIMSEVMGPPASMR